MCGLWRLRECFFFRPAAKTPQEKYQHRTPISATDAQIDKLAYELYGLTEDEIRIVEGVAK